MLFSVVRKWTGPERSGREGKGLDWRGQEWTGEERIGAERKGPEWTGVDRQGLTTACSVFTEGAMRCGEERERKGQEWMGVDGKGKARADCSVEHPKLGCSSVW